MSGEESDNMDEEDETDEAEDGEEKDGYNSLEIIEATPQPKGRFAKYV